MDNLLKSYEDFKVDDAKTSLFCGGAAPFCITHGENYDSDGCSSSWDDNTEDGLIGHWIDNDGGGWT